MPSVITNPGDRIFPPAVFAEERTHEQVDDHVRDWRRAAFGTARLRLEAEIRRVTTEEYGTGTGVPAAQSADERGTGQQKHADLAPAERHQAFDQQPAAVPLGEVGYVRERQAEYRQGRRDPGAASDDQ